MKKLQKQDFILFIQLLLSVFIVIIPFTLIPSKAEFYNMTTTMGEELSDIYMLIKIPLSAIILTSGLIMLIKVLSSYNNK